MLFGACANPVNNSDKDADSKTTGTGSGGGGGGSGGSSGGNNNSTPVVPVPKTVTISCTLPSSNQFDSKDLKLTKLIASFEPEGLYPSMIWSSSSSLNPGTGTTPVWTISPVSGEVKTITIHAYLTVGTDEDTQAYTGNYDSTAEAVVILAANKYPLAATTTTISLNMQNLVALTAQPIETQLYGVYPGTGNDYLSGTMAYNKKFSYTIDGYPKTKPFDGAENNGIGWKTMKGNTSTSYQTGAAEKKFLLIKENPVRLKINGPLDQSAQLTSIAGNPTLKYKVYRNEDGKPIGSFLKADNSLIKASMVAPGDTANEFKLTLFQNDVTLSDIKILLHEEHWKYYLNINNRTISDIFQTDSPASDSDDTALQSLVRKLLGEGDLTSLKSDLYYRFPARSQIWMTLPEKALKEEDTISITRRQTGLSANLAVEGTYTVIRTSGPNIATTPTLYFDKIIDPLRANLSEYDEFNMNVNFDLDVLKTILNAAGGSS